MSLHALQVNPNWDGSLPSHRTPTEYGCGRPEAPSLIVTKERAKDFRFLADLVERGRRADCTQGPEHGHSQLCFPGCDPLLVRGLSNYGIMTPGPVSLHHARAVLGTSDTFVGLGRGNIAGVTVVVIDTRKRQALQDDRLWPSEEPFVMHVATDTYDAGMHIHKSSAALITLRPTAAEVWLYGRAPDWAARMYAQEGHSAKLRRAVWSVTKKQWACYGLVSASMLSAAFVTIAIHHFMFFEPNQRT